MNHITSLHNTIKVIKKLGEENGLTITNEEMAGKIQLPVDQFRAYINGEAKIPPNVVDLLYGAYNDLFVKAQQKNRSAALKARIASIKQRGAEEGLIITEEEMAGKIGIPIEQFNRYVKGEEDTPREVFSMLWDAYKDVLNSNGVTIEWISIKEVVDIDIDEEEDDDD